jgi:RES domain-containing protein
LRRLYAAHPFDGEGAFRYGGRWSSVGTRISYTSEHLSLAMLEYFVHLDADDIPDDLVLAKAEIPDSVPRRSISIEQLPPDWRQTPAPAVLTDIGDRFVRDGEASILIVPSAIATSESNWLINPAHPASAEIRVDPVEPFAYDLRFSETRQ